MKNIAKLIVLFTAILLVVAFVAVTPEIGDDQDNSDINIRYKGHVTVEKFDALNDAWVLVAEKDNLLVDNGKNYIRTQIGSGTAGGSNSTKYISLSNDATSPSTGWTIIPNEITGNGLSRTAATYAANGTGAWNYTYTWTATGAQSVQLTGLNYAATPGLDGNLFAALQFASTSLQANDQLKVVWSISVS